MKRRKSLRVKVGGIYIGGSERITVQSMLNRPASDERGNVEQALELEKAGCEIIRTAVPDFAAVKLIEKLKESVSIPVVADIHFDYRLALESLEAGADKIRINPGNIGSHDRIKAVASACASKGVPIRIGVNSGSLDKETLAEYGAPTAEALAESAMKNVLLLEKYDFNNIVVSIKSSSAPETARAYRIFAEKREYPLHLGITEAGAGDASLIKSAVGLGSLLLDGIGDTIRVSITGDPLKEVAAGINILKAAGVRNEGVEIISCPTCGRTKIDLISLEKEIENRLKGRKENIKVAVMGCAVNGPGEARFADVGVAGGDGTAIIFKKGVIVRRTTESEAADALMEEIEKL